MKKKPKKKTNWLGEPFNGAVELVLELVAVGISALISFVLPEWMTEKIPRAVFYVIGFSLFACSIVLFGMLGAGPRRKTRKNEEKYGKIDPEHLVRRFDLLLGLGFTKETKIKKRHTVVTYTYESKRFISFVLENGRVECFVGLTGDKSETLTASGITDVSGDPTRFDDEYAEASNMHRLMMIGELLDTDSELIKFLTD